MSEAFLFYFNEPDPNRPIENKYVTQINGERKSFMNEEDALLYLFDHGIKTYKYLTKEPEKYKSDITKLLTYEFWHIENRVGYVSYDYQPYIDSGGSVKKKRAYVWRFVGFGRSCFAPTKEELEEKVRKLIQEYKRDPDNRGFNTYPFYTKHFR